MNGTEAKNERFDLEFKVTGGTVKLNPTIVRNYLVSGKRELVTDTEIIMFMQLCRYQGLNPFLREAYLIKYSSSDPATTVVGKDTFTKRAGAIAECGGFNAGVVIHRKVAGKEEIVKRTGTIVFSGEELVGGWGRAYRKGWQEAVESEVSLKEYMRYNKAGEPTKSWREMPATMIRKVALVQVLRETFAENYTNMYSPEEMNVEPTTLPSAPVQFPEGEKVFVRNGEATPPEHSEEKRPEYPPDEGKDTLAESGYNGTPPGPDPEEVPQHIEKPNGFVGRGAVKEEKVDGNTKEKLADRISKMPTPEGATEQGDLIY